jgi:uncharacterized membrane protein YdjX (TVP38/TMEM64 family)
MNQIEENTVASAPESSKAQQALKLVVVIAGLLALMYLGRQAGAYIPRFASWVEGLGIWGPIVYIAAYVLATVAFVPGSLLTLAAGAIFGVVKGAATVFTGATLGACAAFLVSRYLARQAIERRLEGNEKFAKIDSAVGDEGRKIVFLLRLSPVFPFNLLNYGLGLTRVRFADYAIASVGMLPGTFLYVYYGKVAGDVAALAGGAGLEKGWESWALLIVGLVATLIVTTVVTRIARKSLAEATGDD